MRKHTWIVWVAVAVLISYLVWDRATNSFDGDPDNYIIKLTSPDKKKVFSMFHHYDGNNNKYVNTGSLIQWGKGGGSVFYHQNENAEISVKWKANDTLEVYYKEPLKFTLKRDSLYFIGDVVRIIYKPQ